MTQLTISISEDRLARLNELAAQFAVKPEDLLLASLDDLIMMRPDADFKKAMTYVLDKNAELYSRLA
ncbi:MAG: DNA-binding protein [Anaerolineae bacterium]